MRLCRFRRQGVEQIGVYADSRVLPIPQLAVAAGTTAPLLSENLLDYLPPAGRLLPLAQQLTALPAADRDRCAVPVGEVELLVPIPHPQKVILLAGNYAEHIREGGGVAAERQQTFPYFFMKPPSTTLTHPGAPVRIPAVSRNHIDWEIELGVVIGRRCRSVSEAEALKYVAGYTICNDISDRKMQINPARQPREKDRYFDWLHGKWHDTFLPMGPCVLSANAVADPQQFPLRLTVNGVVMQNATTAQMVFPAAALVSILSSLVTLEPGDVISTGTPSGVGFARKPPIFLKPGDVLEATIEGIGTLRNPVAAE
jgi:2-keto-4-pentenoate hydratase/2-oxohepta-3-ene-1,7-dioic acid hydratase in catechol pathway